jgi:hypothetical protein
MLGHTDHQSMAPAVDTIDPMCSVQYIVRSVVITEVMLQYCMPTQAYCAIAEVIGHASPLTTTYCRSCTISPLPMHHGTREAA